jgi:hypothetical protein
MTIFERLRKLDQQYNEKAKAIMQNQQDGFITWQEMGTMLFCLDNERTNKLLKLQEKIVMEAKQ